MKVTLRFLSIIELVDFSVLMHFPQLQIDPKNLTITCELSEADMELAKRSYHASVEDIDPMLNTT